MPYTIHIEGLERAQALLGFRIEPALQAATKAIALEIENVIAPYPPATVANSPGEARWYERGYGPRWKRKDGSVGGSKTSEMLNRSWGIRSVGRWGASVGSRASYAPFVHSKARQAAALQRIGWKTDETAVRAVIQSGAVRRIVTQALVAAMRRR